MKVPITDIMMRLTGQTSSSFSAYLTTLAIVAFISGGLGVAAALIF